MGKSINLLLFFSKITGLLLFCSSALQLDDEVCVEGIVMDRYCIDLKTLLDNPSVATLEQPYKHSVHCLVDVPSCVAGPFEILTEPDAGSSLYKRAYVLDSAGLEQVVSLARSVGVCGTCSGNGNLRAGLRVQVRGIIKSLGTGEVPPLIQVSELEQSQGQPSATFCQQAVPTSPVATPTTLAPSPFLPTSTPTEVLLKGDLFNLEIGLLHLDIKVIWPERALNVKLTYAGLGWIGFGFSPDGQMIGSVAVIGKPSSNSSTDSILKYNLGGKFLAAVSLLSEEQQTLRNVSLVQNTTHTTMQFSKFLVERNETTIWVDGVEANHFIYAYASDNNLGYHQGRGILKIIIPPPPATVAPIASSDLPTLWPSETPSVKPTNEPTKLMTVKPSKAPVLTSSSTPSLLGSSISSSTPSERPSSSPAVVATGEVNYPSGKPTVSSPPSRHPSVSHSPVQTKEKSESSSTSSGADHQYGGLHIRVSALLICLSLLL